jgi:hypothetical protein
MHAYADSIQRAFEAKAGRQKVVTTDGHRKNELEGIQKEEAASDTISSS